MNFSETCIYCILLFLKASCKIHSKKGPRVPATVDQREASLQNGSCASLASQPLPGSLWERSSEMHGFKTQASRLIFISSAGRVAAAKHPIINEVNCGLLSGSGSCFSLSSVEGAVKHVCFPHSALLLPGKVLASGKAKYGPIMGP